jgi:hypothetical protein
MYLEGTFLSLIFPSQKGAAIFFYWNAFFFLLGGKKKIKGYTIHACLLSIK